MDTSPTPIISRALADGTLVEAVYMPEDAATMLAIAERDGVTRLVSEFTLPSGERVVPYSPRNNLIATGCVLLPSDIGDVRDKGDLVREVRTFLHRYVDLAPPFEDIAAHYVLLSWVYDAFNEIPYLRFRGSWGTGKTRALLAVGSLCYKPFFASGASTVSPIFHVLDAFGGTLVLDEADFRHSDATSELTKILNNGTVRGLPVLRTMTNRHKELNPTAFRVFGPKLVAMREGFSDPALESRFLTHETGGRPMRDDIPIHLPDSLAVEARALRNLLLAWRLQARATIAVDPARIDPALSPRINQVTLPLLSIIDDAQLRQAIVGLLKGKDTALEETRYATDHARIVAAMHGAFAQTTEAFVTLADVAERFNAARPHFAVPLSNKAVGAMVRGLGIATTKSRGVYVISQSERGKLAHLCTRFGIKSDASDAGVSQPQA